MNYQEDYRYVIDIIIYLNKKYAIDFFITPNDFDTLFGWCEKKIPLPVIKNSIDIVVLRWKKKEKKVYSFINFKYQVKKDFIHFTDLRLGEHSLTLKDVKFEGKANIDEFDDFMRNFPPDLKPLKNIIKKMEIKISKKNLKQADINNLHSDLIEMFKDHQELIRITKKFLKSLAPRFRNEQMKRQYQLNYLINKYKIPFLEEFINE